MKIEPKKPLTPIRLARQAAGLAQEEVARRAKISLAYYQGIERGKSVPTVHIARRVASTLGSSIEALWPHDVR